MKNLRVKESNMIKKFALQCDKNIDKLTYNECLKIGRLIALENSECGGDITSLTNRLRKEFIKLSRKNRVLFINKSISTNEKNISLDQFLSTLDSNEIRRLMFNQ